MSTKEINRKNTNRKNKRKIIIPAAITLGLLLVFLVLLICNKFHIVIDYEAGQVITVNYGDPLDLPDNIAHYRGSIFNFGKKDLPVLLEDNVDLKSIGEHKTTLTASYKKCSASVPVTIVVVDKSAPVIELISDPNYFTKPNHKYVEEGYKATDNYDGDVTDKVITEEKDGIVTYTVSDSFGNRAVVTRTINYKDTTPPVIKLKGGNKITSPLLGTYKEPGYTTKDDCDGDLTNKVTVSGNVDSKTEGTYTLTYTVTDSYNNTAAVTRTVIVKDCNAPKLTVSGDSTQYIKLGDTYTTPSLKAIDDIDGDITDKIKASGSVNTSKKGVYSVDYSVTDKAGNTSTVSHCIYVYEKQAENKVVNPGKKVVYLTFDDGPSSHTQKVLKVLKKYNVKATFFVTSQYRDYKHCIKDAYNDGHTIALHTASHAYNVIYSSRSEYFKDLEKISDYVYDIIGVRPNIIRFPGGSSNTTSISYCKGIMSSLVKDVGVMGYLYCDWNVSSGDAGETTSTSVVVKNVINGIKNNNISVVLQHDTSAFSVNAVEEIVAWGLANGYTFLPLTSSSPMTHHNVNN